MPKCPRCGTTRFRTPEQYWPHVNRWCQAPLPGASRSTTSTATSTTASITSASPSTSTSARTTEPQLGKRRREEEVEEDVGVEEKKGDDAGPELSFEIFPEEDTHHATHAGGGPPSPAPLPERPLTMKESDYRIQVKYLELSSVIHDNISAAEISETSRHELFLMKFCINNGLGRDQGQQLLNWMKGVSPYQYCMRIG